MSKYGNGVYGSELFGMTANNTLTVTVTNNLTKEKVTVTAPFTVNSIVIVNPGPQNFTTGTKI